MNISELSKLTLLVGIVSFRDDSSLNKQRLKIDLKNGYTLSVIRGEGTYCDMDDPNSFEVAGTVTGGSPDGKLLGLNIDNDYYDDVIGWQTTADIVKHLRRLATLTAIT